MVKRVFTTILGMAAALFAVDAVSFARDARDRLVRDPERRQVPVSASRDVSQVRPGRRPYPSQRLFAPGWFDRR